MQIRRGVLLLLVLLSALGAGLYFWLLRDLPAPTPLQGRLNIPSVRITDRAGRLLYEALPENGGRHTVVPLAQIPLICQQAAIATEDRYFYQNPGIDLIGILRAAWINLRGGEAGGSTITQQVVRTLLLDAGESSQRTLRRKLREAILAWEVTQKLSKDDILALYFNQTYYGGLAYGIEAAAQTFFGKPVAELGAAECALLAGLPQTPARYNPFTDPEAASARQKVVLGLLAEQGYISAEQSALAQRQPLTYNPTPYPIQAPHFVMLARDQLDSLFSEEALSASGGLTVQTTLNLDWQRLAEEAVRLQVQRVKEDRNGLGHNLNSAALVAIDPYSGEILSLVGSPDYFDAANGGAINMALAPRQPGSSLKPLVYAAAFDPRRAQPWTAATMLLDVQHTFLTHDGEAYIPKNYDGLEHGPVLARQALASSLNIPAVMTLEHIGLAGLINFTGRLGITTLQNPSDYDLSLALGGGDVKLLELTAAYGAFANGGRRVQPYAIEQVTDAQGKVLYRHEAEAQPQVLDERVAWLISDILSDNDARLLGFGRNSALRLDRPAAVKTGTTSNFHDNWTIGYTPDVVVGVWAGNTNYEPMHDITGLTGAAPIWHQFLRAALTGTPERSFRRPSGMAQVEICALSGELPSDDCPYRRGEWFIAGTQPAEADTLYHKVVVDRLTGALARAATPPERRREVLALDLPPEAARWAHAQSIVLLSDLQGTGAASNGGIRLNAPAPGSIYQISASLPAENQRLHIEAISTLALSEATIWLDGLPLATMTQPPYETWWPLEAGDHSLWATALTETGEEISSPKVQIKVVKSAK